MSLIVLMALIVLAAGSVGYYLGAQVRNRANAVETPTQVPTVLWVDQEVVNKAAGSGSYVPYLHCTYHWSSGAVQIHDYLNLGANAVQRCPSSPQ